MLMTVSESWFAVVITWAFAWKARCAVIMFTSCVVRSTFEASKAPRRTETNPRRAGRAGDVGARGEGLRPVGVAQLFQSLRVGKIGQCQLPELGRAAVGVHGRN